MIRGAVAVAALFLGAGLARAQDAGDKPLSVAVIVDGLDAPKLGPRLRAAARSALADDTRLRVRTVELGGALNAPATAALEAADAALANAAHLFEELDLDDARVDAGKAIAGYERYLTQLEERDGNARRLRDAQVMLSKIAFFAGDFDHAKDALRRAFVIDPKLVYNSQVFPIQMRRTAVEARLLFDTLGAGVIEVSTTPPGARIWLNGVRLPQRTPSRLDAEAGPNTIELRLPGYRTARRSVEVAASTDDSRARVVLEPDDSPEGRARAATAALATGSDPGDLDALATAFDVNALILLHAEAKSDSEVELSGALFMRGRSAASGREERDAKPPDLEDEETTLLRALAGRAEATPVVAIVSRRRRPQSDGEGFRHSRYFWWVVGGAAAVVVAGVALGVGLGIHAHQAQVARETVLLGGQ